MLDNGFWINLTPSDKDQLLTYKEIGTTIIAARKLFYPCIGGVS